MEERRGDGFFSGGLHRPRHDHQLYPYNYLCRRPASRPPLTAIDRFLSGQSHLNSQLIQYQNNAKNSEIPLVSAANGNLGSSWQYSIDDNILHEESFFGGLFVDLDGEASTVNRTVVQDQRNGDTCSKGETEFVENYSCKEMGKRAEKGSSSAALIKGQWTDEEDRYLCIELCHYIIRSFPLYFQRCISA